MSDEAAVDALGGGALNDLVNAILHPDALRERGKSVYEALLSNKGRAHLIAALQHALTQNYSVDARLEDGRRVFVSPSEVQWYPDGVMFHQGAEKFGGMFGLYEKGEVRFGVAARTIAPREHINRDDIEFLPIEEVRRRSAAVRAAADTRLEESVARLEALLNARDTAEARYQELLEDCPWMLGAEYRVIQRHPRLDDATIPDFSGVRVADDARDVIEIKQPFLNLFTKDGDLSAEFNAAWNQAERYLNFVREEKDYLRRKGFLFTNPKCWLLIGRGLSEAERQVIAGKERLIPSIRVLTYDDLVIYAKYTIAFVRERMAELAERPERHEASPPTRVQERSEQEPSVSPGVPPSPLVK